MAIRRAVSQFGLKRTLVNGVSQEQVERTIKLDENLGSNITVVKIKTLRRYVRGENDGLFEVWYRQK
ncbi:hypothetical protein CMI37_09355 [Candidatus Pacearchaeota archaeon]|nr:hypothetical protein [Candidatus Pacearchaeota archaeon]|tara:strand:- start:2365 stop:2565 length:201 start_codon:yes stop_codon:yes gene_type:complete